MYRILIETIKTYFYVIFNCNIPLYIVNNFEAFSPRKYIANEIILKNTTII